MARRAVTGPELIDLLVEDGWTKVRRTTHGIWLTKWDPQTDRERRTVVPDKPGSLAKSTLGQILSSQQTGLGAAGLQRLLDRKRRRRRGEGGYPPDESDTGANPAYRRPQQPSGPYSAAVQAPTESTRLTVVLAPSAAETPTLEDVDDT